MDSGVSGTTERTPSEVPLSSSSLACSSCDMIHILSAAA